MPPILAVVTCISHVTLIRGLMLSGRKLKTGANKALAFLRRILQFDFRSSSRYLLGMRRLQEKCVSLLSFQRKSVTSGALEMQPVSPCMGVYGEMEVSRLPPDETAIFMFNSCDWGGLELSHCCNEMHLERM